MQNTKIQWARHTFNPWWGRCAQFKTQGQFIVIKTTGEIEHVPAILSPHKQCGRRMSRSEHERNDAHCEQLRGLVGGWIETLHQRKLQGVRVVVNEEGLKIGLPVNGLATVLFEHALVGDVLICKDGMYSDGLSDEATARVMAAIDAVPDQTLRLYRASGESLFVKVERERSGSDGMVAVVEESKHQG
jgi:hypothetical protein